MIICPKCQYKRKETDTAPDWQCPSCGVAYVKAAAALEQARQAATVPASTPAAASVIHMERDDADNQSGFASRGMQIIGAIFGMAVSRYLGIQFFMPLISTLIAFALTRSLDHAGGARIRGAVAVQAGHAFWLGFGLIYTHQFNANLLDLAWYAIGLAWLVAKRSAGPLYMLGIYQVLALMVNAYMFTHAPADSIAFKALIVHMLWRVMSLVLMAICWLDIRRLRAQAE